MLNNEGDFDIRYLKLRSIIEHLKKITTVKNSLFDI
jgi:hypothetical protein